MIIDPKDISFEAIKEEIENYIKSLPDYNTWKDFFACGVGQTIIELLAGWGTYLATKIVVTRREVFLAPALLRSSVLAIAETLGYSATRGQNPRLSVTFTPNVTMSLALFTPVGTIGQYGLYSAGSYTLNSGTPVTIEVIVGELKGADDDIYIDITTADPTVFRYTDITNVSDDFKLFLNDVELPTTNTFKELLDDKYLVMTNYIGSVDVIYLNDGVYKYGPGDRLYLIYMEYVDGMSIPEMSKVSLFYGDVLAASISAVEVSQESLDHIKIAAPLFHETQMLVRARNDYMKLLKVIIPNAVDTNGIDDTNNPNPKAQVDITYVLDNPSSLPEPVLLTSTQKAQVLAELDKYRPLGIPLPDIFDPVLHEIELDITVTLQDTTVSVTNVRSAITNILTNYEKKLGATISLNDIEYDIEYLKYVKIARITSASRLSMGWREYAIITYDLTLV